MTLTHRLFALKDVLTSAEGLPYQLALYLPEGDWTLETRCALFDPDDESGQIDDEPVFAREHGLVYACPVKDLQDVVANMKQQYPFAAPHILLSALVWYLEHDAFLVLNSDMPV